jgi:hypothetical protein
MPATGPTLPRPDVNRQRHIKAFSYATVGLGAAIGARFLIGLDVAEIYAFSVSVYVTLVLMNYRTLLTRVPETPTSVADARSDRLP